MKIGIPRERGGGERIAERRVALTPAGVREVVEAGATVYVEAGAGGGAGFEDEAYRRAGATVVYTAAEAFGRADLVLRVERPSGEEVALLPPGAALLAFLHLAAAPKALVQEMLGRRTTAIGLELVRRDDGVLPVLRAMSEIAGRLAPQIAGRLLETPRGPGVLLAGMPGIPPAEVVIIGAGTLGLTAARAFLGLGTSVSILDRALDRLELADQIGGGRVVTAIATHDNIDKFASFANVVVGAAHVPGERAPILLTRPMVRRMRAGAVILDFAIDQGGIAETSTLTPREEHVFVEEGVIHFCAPNVPALVARTASQALTAALLPYVRELAARGPAALDEVPELARAVSLRDGKPVRGVAGGAGPGGRAS
jgi:alanine dehydrogenase